MRIFFQLTCFLIPLIFILAGCAPGTKPSELDRILPQQSPDSERETGHKRSDLTASPYRNNSTSAPVATHTKSPFPADSNPSKTPLVPAAFPTDQNIPTQTTNSAPVQIQINNPGSGSRVTSPIQVVSQLSLQGAKLIRIELRGEDGRLLSRILKTPSVFPWSSASVSIPLLFEIRAPEQPAFLSISAEDLYGRVIALNTSMIMLVKEYN